MPRSKSRLYTLMEAAVAGVRVEDFGCRVEPLLEATRRGLPAVDTWILPAQAFRDAVSSDLPPGHDPAALIRSIHKPNGLERAARARDRAVELKLPEELTKELGDLVKAHGQQGFGLAVRASPTLADDSLVVAAGLDQVVYGARTEAALLSAIRSTFALVFDERTLAYLREHRLRDIGMAVLIQRLPVVAASMLVLSNDRRPVGAPPVERPKLPDSHLASTSLGLGAPVRDGASPHDVLRLGADGSTLARRLAEKREAVVVDDSGPTTVAIEAARATRCAMDDERLSNATQLVRKLEPSEPREVELLQGDDGSLAVAEVRTLSGAGYPLGGEASTVWSRTGIADLLPSAPTPLTASLVEHFCESSLRSALSSLGAEVQKSNRLLARVHGRYYLNVSALVPAVSGVPGVEPAVVLELLRGADPARVARAITVQPAKHSVTASSLAAARLLLHERRLTDAVTRFERDAEQHRRWLAEMDLAILPDDSLVTTLRESNGFLETTGQLLLKSSIVALAGHLALEAVLSRVVPDTAGHVARTLGSGVPELESVRAPLALAHVVEILRADTAAADAVRSGMTRVDQLPAGAGRRALQGFIDGFGERGLTETEALLPRFREDATELGRLLRAGLAAPAADPDLRLSRVRTAADSALAALENEASSFEMMLVRALLGRARAFARLRERMRVWMARTMAMMRTVTMDVDRRLRRLDPALRDGAAFFLTADELRNATARTRADLGPIVRMRREMQARDLARPDPPDTFVGAPLRWTVPSFDGRLLTGAAASGGVATGRVRRVGPGAAGAENLAPGDIVLLRVPDPGLAPLFFWCGAVVADAGSALSHAAVVAREIGTPAVFGVVDAWSTLREGEEVRVDGDLGRVERLAP